MEASLERAASSGAVIVLPWGFGKWTGRRGKIIRRLLENGEAPVFHLGDNSGRLKYWPKPREFSIAAERGLQVLPGTDPLPFPTETARVGRFGFALPMPVSIKTPASDLVSRLSDPDIRPIPYGRCEGLFRFLKNQVNMQLIKHGRRKTPEALPRDPGAS